MARESHKKTIEDVANALELTPAMVESVENGEKCPDEDMLMMLINHFDIEDQEASKLWDLAGFEEPEDAPPSMIGPEMIKHMAIVMPIDSHIVYTDMVHVMANGYGIVMNFMQHTGPDNTPVPVSRVGMSREHAQSIIDLLQQTLAQSVNAPKAIKQISPRKTPRPES